MTETFYIRRNDRLPSISATLKDANGTAVNLTGATVKFNMRLPKAASAKVNTAATVDNAAGGQVSYAWGVTDTDTAGIYNAEFEVTWGDGRKQTFPNNEYIEVTVSADLA